LADSRSVVRRSVLREVLQAHGFIMKKSLGQNFLIDENVLDKIIQAGELGPADGVFEIGPGAGVLTQRAATLAKKVIAIEKDRRLEPILQETIGTYGNVQLIYGDVLELDLVQLWNAFQDCRRVIVIANLPYYVTTPILFQLLESGISVSDIIVMVQSEVAQRLTAVPATKAYSALTVAVTFRAEVRTVAQVRKGAFLPPPGVDSTVVRLRCYQQPPVAVVDDQLFKRVVRAAFATRRKTLQNALGHGLNLHRSVIQTALQRAEIDPQRRGETLSLQEFSALTNALSESVPHTRLRISEL
jgi:16S rRNA (adenine1518-N6/adenine1519-N6)-dimethyltransferase